MSAPALPITPALAERIMAWRAPDEIISRNGSPMFQRWWLARNIGGPDDRDGRGRPKGNVYLHHWLRSDPEDAHCHPWWNETTVIVGRMVEEVFCPHRIGLYDRGKATPIRRELTAGGTAMREPDAIHRIVEVDPGTVSLFITGPKVREWGFWLGGKFVPWRAYHGLPADTPATYRAGAMA